MITDFSSSVLTTFLFFLNKTAIFWAPLGLSLIAWRLWVHYINRLYLSELKWTMLQIKLPKEVHKSPQAMEIVLANALYQTGGVGTWYHKWWLGNLLAWFSLEIVSIDGNIYFFIRTQTKFKNIIEAQTYAQYPQAEISEVGDYVLRVPPHTKNGEWNMWGTEFVLTEKDPYPIKTYTDYGLDKAIGSLEEEQRIDPITPTLEFMGSLKKGEEVWLQILVRPPANKKAWKERAKAEIKAIRDEHKPKADGGAFEPLTKGEQDKISAIERSVSKFAFECGIRAIYLARKDAFRPENITALLGTFRQYNSENLNGFKPKNATGFEFPWQDLTGNKTVGLKKDILNAYKLRSYFYPPYQRAPFVLTTEELATIFHFPGRVSETPSFARIDSKKTEPPTNLPS